VTAEGFVGVVRPILLALPALIVVLFVGLIWFAALWMSEPRRKYALAVSNSGIELARVLVGLGSKAASTASLR
jgi:hypothetical protein